MTSSQSSPAGHFRWSHLLSGKQPPPAWNKRLLVGVACALVGMFVALLMCVYQMYHSIPGGPIETTTLVVLLMLLGIIMVAALVLALRFAFNLGTTSEGAIK